MKKLLILFLISFLNADVAELITSIEDIKKYKKEQNSKINSIYNPFLNYNNKKQIKPLIVEEIKETNNKSIAQLKLEVIFDKRAKIDSTWYKKGDKIGKITVWKILSDRVILKEGKKQTVLSIKSKNILKVTK
jgi:hypothetical protein